MLEGKTTLFDALDDFDGQAATAVISLPPVPAKVTWLEERWHAIGRMLERLAAVAKDWEPKGITVDSYGLAMAGSWDPMEEHRESANGSQRGLTKAALRYAMEDVAPSGCTLPASEDEVLATVSKHARRESDLENWAPEAIYRAVTDAYTGQAGAMVKRKVAQQLNDAFLRSWWGQDAVTITRKGITVSIPMSVDERFGSKDYEYNSRGRAREAITAFITWLDADGQAPEPSHCIRGIARDRFGCHGGDVVSKEATELMEGVTMVTYKSSLKFHLSTAIAEQLEDFVSTWGGDENA